MRSKYSSGSTPIDYHYRVRGIPFVLREETDPTRDTPLTFYRIISSGLSAWEGVVQLSIDEMLKLIDMQLPRWLSQVREDERPHSYDPAKPIVLESVRRVGNE